MKLKRGLRKFNWRDGGQNIRGELANWITQYQAMAGASLPGGGRGLPVIVGLVDQRNREYLRNGTDFLYGDHAYFQRGWVNRNFRLIRGAHHLTHVLPRPDDRLKRWNVQIEPWRTGGRAIVVIPPSPYYHHLYSVGNWLETTVGLLKQYTDRPIHVKQSKGRLRECLLEEQDAWALVCCISVAGMEAALIGVPVFSTPHCCSWPMNAGPLERIESPERPDRHDWACSLAYASWNADELDSIDFSDYQYTCCEPSPPVTKPDSISTGTVASPA